LQAFCKYKVESSSDLHLIAAGISPQLKRNLKKVKGLNWEVINRYVKFMDYVSSEDLQELYKGCKFLLYTSKSEGYGLPPLEAMNYMKPTVASSITSVPEVLGFAAHYVNPYEINSIAKGISFMDNPSNQQYYINLMKKLKPAIYRRGKEDIKSFVRELFLNWE
jgi:glycosyltransferase involved in cell wall biosynthesis